MEKIKTIGSCYMAASGLAPDKQVRGPHSSSTHSTRALLLLLHSSPIHVCPPQASMNEWNHLSELVLFALAMQQTLKEVNRHSAKNFQLRVGERLKPMRLTHSLRQKHKHTHIWCQLEYFTDFCALGAGIAHGPVVAGVIGATKPQYDIWGSTVNLASRMDSTGVRGRIQVPEATRRILAEWGFVLELRGEIFVKGVSGFFGVVLWGG